MWKFELLNLPELRRLAAEDAALADVIMVSFRGDRELPVPVRAWIKVWLGRKAGAVALIALLDGPPEQRRRIQAVQAFLERAAQRARMEFFAWPLELLEQGRGVPGLALARAA